MAVYSWLRDHAIASAVVAGLLVALAWPAAAFADERRDRQWHLPFLSADAVHKITKGDGVTVAVVDTGVDGNHVDLKGNVLEGEDFTSTVGGDGWTDTTGHGTGMASLIAAHGHGSHRRDGVLGLAPQAKILPVRGRTGGSDDPGFGDEAIRWAVDHGAKVINFSGIESGLEDSVNYALSHDVVVVAAAGNAKDGDVAVVEPARFPGVIAVSGIDRSGRFIDESVEGREVALAAPAENIVGAGAGRSGPYGSGTGTSSAAALVSAAAALVRAKYPDLNAASVIERLVRTADDKGEKGRDSKYGFGVVNPLMALTADVPAVDKNPLGGPAADPSESPSSSAEASESGVAGATGKDSGSATLLVAGSALGVGVAAVLGLVALLAVRSRRRRPGRMQPVAWQRAPPLGGGLVRPPPNGPPGPPSGWPPSSDDTAEAPPRSPDR